jgi:hypothetical protein
MTHFIKKKKIAPGTPWFSYFPVFKRLSGAQLVMKPNKVPAVVPV